MTSLGSSRVTAPPEASLVVGGPSHGPGDVASSPDSVPCITPSSTSAEAPAPATLGHGRTSLPELYFLKALFIDI